MLRTKEMAGKIWNTKPKPPAFGNSKTFSSLEHIRLRTGMYIGRLGDGSDPEDGSYVLLKEVVDNAVYEFIMGVGSSRMSGVNNVALWTGIQASPYVPFINIAPIVGGTIEFHPSF